MCDAERPEAGYQKVALFAVADETTHAARQLAIGRWTSKLGPREDIEHGLRELEGYVYGTVAMLLKREKSKGTRIILGDDPRPFSSVHANS